MEQCGAVGSACALWARGDADGVSCAGVSGRARLEPAWAKLETWRQEGSRGLLQASPRARGDLRSGQASASARPWCPPDRSAAERVWDLARPDQGEVYAATGDLRQGLSPVRPREGAAWTVVLDAADTQALSLAATPEGKVFVGTGPSGQVIEVTDAEHPASRPDPKVQYIWDLAERRRWASSTRPPDRAASSGSGPATASGRWSWTARRPTC